MFLRSYYLIKIEMCIKPGQIISTSAIGILTNSIHFLALLSRQINLKPDEFPMAKTERR